jgi:FMN phosphatase YigB (HAD superfamily)
VRAILFDLDGTLLDIDIDSFLRTYFGALGASTQDRYPGVDVLGAILASTALMQSSHQQMTNREAFNADFLDRTGIDLDASEHSRVFEDFYRQVFPTLGKDFGPAKGARRAVTTALELGLRVVVATQPIFPRAAIEHRLAWAGLTDLGLRDLTTYECMHSCKPQPEYFREAAAMAGHSPSDCLMVGDDRTLDMPAADTGMRTFYVGGGSAASADWSGDLDDLADLLPRLVADDAASPRDDSV